MIRDLSPLLRCQELRELRVDPMAAHALKNLRAHPSIERVGVGAFKEESGQKEWLSFDEALTILE